MSRTRSDGRRPRATPGTAGVEARRPPARAQVDGEGSPDDAVLIPYTEGSPDDAVLIPYTDRRLGADAVVGLVPVRGDRFGAVLSADTVAEALRNADERDAAPPGSRVVGRFGRSDRQNRS